MFAVLNYGSYDLWQNYHKVTFDGPNKIIRVNDGVTELDIKVDVYSDWKEWISTRDDNARYLPAVRSIGGDPTVEGQTAGDIYFLINGWKLYIDLTKVKVTGTLFSDDFDSAYFDLEGNAVFPAQVSSLVSGVSATSGATPADVWGYTSRTLTQEISASAPTTAQIAQAVWEYLTRTLTESSGTNPADIWSYSSRTLTTTAAPSASATAAAVWNAANTSYNTAGTMGSLLNEVDYVQKQIWVNLDADSNGDGGQATPYDNINDAIDKAETDGIDIINLIGDITLNRNFKNFTLRGIGLPEVNLNGQNVKNSKFQNVKIKGTYQEGSGVIVQESILQNGAYLEGFFENCALGGDLICQDTATVLLKDCVSNIPGTARPTISMNAGGTSQLSVRGYNGGLTIKDCNNAADRVTVEMNPGSLTFDSSCTNGIMVARGVGKFVDNTTGASVTDETVNQSITDAVEASVSAVQTTVNTIDTNVDTIDGLVRTVDTVVDGIAEETSSISSAVVTLNNTVNNITAETSSISSALVTLDGKVDTVDTVVDSITNDVNTISNNLNTVDTVVDSISNDLSRVEGKVDIIDTNVDEIEVIVRDIDVSDLNSLSSAIATVQSSVDAIDTTSLSTNIAAVAEDLESISANILAINVTDLDSLSSAIATVQSSVDAIDTTSLSTNIATVQASVDAIDTTSLSSNIAAVQSVVDTTNTTVNTINTNLNTVNTNLNTVDTVVDSISNDVGNVLINLESISSTVAAIDTTSLSTNIAAVQASVDAIDTTSLSTNIAAVQASVDAIDTTSLSTNIAAVQSDIATVQTSVDAIDTTSLSTNIATAQASLSAQNATIQSSINTAYGVIVGNNNKLVSQSAELSTIKSTTTQIYSTQLNQVESTSAINAKVIELWRLAGLDANNITDITDTSITFGDVTITISAPDNNTTRLTRS